MTLEELIQRAAKKGELTHLSICYVGGEFRASMAPASAANGYVTASGSDPIEALKQVLNVRSARTSKVAPAEITAAVIEREPPKNHVCADPAGGERCNICFGPIPKD